MLKALYDYALRHDLTLPAGYINKTVKAYILLYGDGRFQDIELGTDEAIPAPDIGSLANGKDKSNVLLETDTIVFASFLPSIGYPPMYQNISQENHRQILFRS